MQTGPRLVIVLLQPPSCWDCRSEALCLDFLLTSNCSEALAKMTWSEG